MEDEELDGLYIPVPFNRQDIAVMRKIKDMTVTTEVLDHFECIINRIEGLAKLHWDYDG